jgi:trehalose-6-phosphate synthase
MGVLARSLEARPVEASSRRKLFVVSNRLPVRVQVDRGGVAAEPTAGGLTSALRALGGEREWIGWPGAAMPARHQAAAGS